MLCLQSSMQMSDAQKANMMEARVLYIKKIGELLLERQELRVKLQVNGPFRLSVEFASQ